MGSVASLPSHNYPVSTYTLPYNRPRPSDFKKTEILDLPPALPYNRPCPSDVKKTGILDLPPELLLDIFVISSTLRPHRQRQGSSPAMYNLASSCKYLYDVFKANEYTVFSRIVTRSIPQGLSYDLAMKLICLSHLEYCCILKVLVGEKEIVGEDMLDSLWRDSSGLQHSLFWLWPPGLVIEVLNTCAHRPRDVISMTDLRLMIQSSWERIKRIKRIHVRNGGVGGYRTPLFGFTFSEGDRTRRLSFRRALFTRSSQTIPLRHAADLLSTTFIQPEPQTDDDEDTDVDNYSWPAILFGSLVWYLAYV